jgi:hypothetical protein
MPQVAYISTELDKNVIPERERINEQISTLKTELDSLFKGACEKEDPVTKRPYATIGSAAPAAWGCRVTLFNNQFLQFAVRWDGKLEVSSSI